MIDFSTLSTLESEEQYQLALKAVRPYFENEPETETPDATHFDMLIRLIENYEAKHYPVLASKPTV